MNIGIITQPLHGNYGGILQNYALHQELKRLGHSPVTCVFRERPGKKSFMASLKYKLRLWLNKYRHIYLITEQQREYISAEPFQFVQNEIACTAPILLPDDLANLKLDAVIVGSDQVWRPMYSNVSRCFCDFADGTKLKRIAYAASFGTDTWELDDNLTIRCAALAKQFDGISVREISGVKLCQEYLNVSAKHVLDPTLLAEREIYDGLIDKYKTGKYESHVIAYILDCDKTKRENISRIAHAKGLTADILMPHSEFQHVGPKHIDDCVFMHPAKWLAAIRNAKYVITDSFHGTVFCIIFNKPFVTITNVNRGNSRFESLLAGLGLQNRLIGNASLLTTEMLDAPINWSRINEILKVKREESRRFLIESLNK